jgi:hypothetical protein
MKLRKAFMTRASIRRGIVSGASILIFAALSQPALVNGQANRGSTTSGMFGSTTLGSTNGASPQSLGQGMTQGMSSGATQSGAGQGGITNTQSQMIQGGGPVNVQAGGSTGFIGQSSANNAQNFYASGQGARGNQNFSALSQLMAKAQQNQFNQQQAQKNARSTQQAQSQFRVPLRLGFQPQPVPASSIVPYVQRMTKIPGLARLGPIQATLEGRTAVLRGTVASEADRQLAEGLARLEPEVMAVRNELVVGNPSNSGTTVEALPPASGSAR